MTNKERKAARRVRKEQWKVGLPNYYTMKKSAFRHPESPVGTYLFNYVKAVLGLPDVPTTIIQED